MKGTLFIRGEIYTLGPAVPRVEALAVSAGRVVAAGATADLRRTFPEYSTVDLGGRTVYPGFIDSHIHLAAYGLSLRTVQLRDAQSLGDAVGRVRLAAARAQEGEWVQGRGWDKNLWPEGRFPTKDDLDPVTPSVHASLTSKDGHLLWVNSSALRLAGVDAGTPDPPGGEISRDRRGNPTGIFKERAKELIWNVIPRSGPEAVERSIREATAVAHQLGLVGVHAFEGAEVFAACQRLQQRGELRLRVWMAIPEETFDGAAACGLRTGFGNEWLRVGPVKIFADGTLGSQTANMLEPFEGQHTNTGIAIHTRDDLIALVGRAVDRGFWCAIHAIGDQANRWVLDAYQAHSDRSNRLGMRHRIEHVQLLHPDDLGRLGHVAVIASMQPIHATSDRAIADQYWGRRSRYAYAWRSLLAHQTRVIFGSDAPVETPDVLQGLYAAVTRRRPRELHGRAWYPEEALTLEEALSAYTIDAAFASGEETVKGMLIPNRFADFVVLNRDLQAIPAEEILQTQVEATAISGELVYTAPTFAG